MLKAVIDFGVVVVVVVVEVVVAVAAHFVSC